MYYLPHQIANNEKQQRENRKRKFHRGILCAEHDGPNLHENLSFGQLMINVCMHAMMCLNWESKNINKTRCDWLECSVTVFTIVLHA